MKHFNKNSLDSMADVFAAWAGGYPGSRKETEAFLQQSGLKDLLTVPDVERIFYHNAYFSEETIAAVYSLVPIKLKLQNREEALLPQMFNRLNQHTAQTDNSRVLNLNFGKADEIFCRYYPNKHKYLLANKQQLAQFNSRQRKTSKPKKLPKIISEAQKMLVAIAKRIYSKKYREAHREELKLKQKEYRATHKEELSIKRKKYRELHKADILIKERNRRIMLRERKRLQEEEKRRTAEKERQEKKAALKEASRLRNITYREKHREEIRQRANDRRLLLKENNPEFLQEYDKKVNQRQSRAEAGKRYYENHKEIITQKAQDNPKVKEYKKRYKAKMRFQKTTSKLILPLLQGIINAKE